MIWEVLVLKADVKGKWSNKNKNVIVYLKTVFVNIVNG